jgi:hypothetical protein
MLRCILYGSPLPSFDKEATTRMWLEEGKVQDHIRVPTLATHDNRLRIHWNPSGYESFFLPGRDLAATDKEHGPWTTSLGFPHPHRLLEGQWEGGETNDFVSMCV